jgi:predicted NAD/FAD-binding protein
VRLIRLVNPDHARALLRLPLQWHMHREFRLATTRLPAPLHLLAGLLTAQGLDLSERLAAIRFMHALRNSDFTLTHDTSVGPLLQRHRQSEKLNRVLWRPLCVAALNTPPQAASARVFLNVLRDTLGAQRDASDLLLSRVDLSALFPEPAAAFVGSHGGAVERGRRVTAIDPRGDAFAIETEGRRDTFTHVVCALPRIRSTRF